MSPASFLALTIGITAAAMAAQMIVRHRRRSSLRELARVWDMHYSPGDRFRLAARVAERFPVPGASDVRVNDLIYGNEDELHRYIFSAEYTEGVIRSKKRVRRVVTFTEPKGRSDATKWSAFVLADKEKPLVDQYKELREKRA
jgi:hypothetical protein